MPDSVISGKSVSKKNVLDDVLQILDDMGNIIPSVVDGIKDAIDAFE